MISAKFLGLSTGSGYDSNGKVNHEQKALENVDKFEDMKISPLEIPALILPAFKIINMTDGKYIDEFFGIDSEAIGMILFISILNTIVVILTSLISIVYFVLHIYNGNGVGLPILALNLLSLGTMKLSSYFVNVNFPNDIYEKVVNLSIVPFISLVALIVSFITWKSAIKSKSLLNTV